MTTTATIPTNSTDALAAWLAQEAAVRALRDRPGAAGPGAASAAQIAGKTGFEVLQGLLTGELPYAAISNRLDFLLVEVGTGTAVFQGAPGPQHFNPMGGVHGGWYASLLDSALGCAVHTLMPAGRGYTTAELSVNIVRALPPNVGRVRAIGRVLHCGRQLATADAQLIGPDGKLYAHATTTCLVFELPAAR